MSATSRWARQSRASPDNSQGFRGEAAFTELCDACLIPARSGRTDRHRRNRHGHRPVHATLYRVVIVWSAASSRDWTIPAGAPDWASSNPRSSAVSNTMWHVKLSGIATPSKLWVVHQQPAAGRNGRITAMAGSVTRTLKVEAVYDLRGLRRGPAAWSLHDFKRLRSNQLAVKMLSAKI